MAMPEREARNPPLVAEPMWPPKELLDLYRLAQDVRKYHHSAMWEIEKHFTWWASVLLGGCVLIFVNKNNVGEAPAYMMLIVVAVFGFFISLMGKKVVEREGKYFGEALQICNRVARALGLERHRFDVVPRRRSSDGEMEPAHFFLYPDNYWIRDFNAVEDDRLWSKLKEGRLNVRDYFRLVLFVTQVAFSIIGVIAVVLGVLAFSSPTSGTPKMAPAAPSTALPSATPAAVPATSPSTPAAAQPPATSTKP